MSTELEEARAHWRRLRACETAEDFRKEGWGSTQCSLCVNREASLLTLCDMMHAPCPVYLATGYLLCKGTPYSKAARLIKYFCFKDKRGIGPVHEAIDEEIAFLDSLTEDQSDDE